MARFPLTIALIRPGDTWISRASRLILISIGFMNSSNNISPGCIGSSNRLGAILHLPSNDKENWATDSHQINPRFWR